MNKEEFLLELKNGLSGLPREDIDACLSFYSEMIDDRMEEGLDEYEAVAGIGPVSEIVAQTIAEIPLPRLVKERIAPKRRLQIWEIVLLVLGFPLWFPLLIAGAAVVLSLYIVVWALLISLWAVELSVAVSVLGALGMAVAYFLRGRFLAGIAMLGAGLVCAGIAVFLFYGCVAASKGLLSLTKKAALAIKTKFLRKENER